MKEIIISNLDREFGMITINQNVLKRALNPIS